MSGRILVLGATGTVGAHVVAGLVARGENVKAASRGATPVAGAEAVRFDHMDPSTHEAAFDGVDRAYVLVPSGYLNTLEILSPIIERAAGAGTKVVFQSVIGVDADDSIPYRQAELQLERSGTRWVTLRPNWFMDNFHTYWRDGIVRHGVITVPAADGKTSFIDARDIAASAVAALTTDRFDNRAFNLTGPEALSYHEAAASLSNLLGRSVTYRPVDDETFVGIVTAAGVPEDYARFLAAIFHPVREGWASVVTPDVETLTGRAPRDLGTYARDNAARFSA
ncbi:SDR family oxidoreductase [Rubellimicrobium arenae]|uniref:SDR family oxidoreductase n=1 Tax=Rubellimicrobium arenae TaxID=2817372 RepID=UPI001B30919C|nr:SDR family oxidoreductase [Rubellimicrobium arenae]